jgi:hypothetical protein
VALIGCVLVFGVMTMAMAIVRDRSGSRSRGLAGLVWAAS